MIFRLASLDSLFVSAAVAAGVLTATSATKAHRDVLFRGSAKDSDAQSQSTNKNMNGLHVPRKLADKNGVVDKKGLDLSLHMESREEKAAIHTGRNHQLRNYTNTKYFVSPMDDAGNREDSIAVDTTAADNIIDVGILHGNAVPFNAKGERNLDQDGTMDRDQYCIETCGLDRKKIPYGAFIQDLVRYCSENLCKCEGVPEGVEINYRCPNQISCWDTSQITNMYGAFNVYGIDDISLRCWDVSSVTTMEYMFFASGYNRNIYNRNINDWDVSSVRNMFRMFGYDSSFNADISGWNTSSVTSMMQMFYRSTEFNQDIGSWDVSSVINMWGLFLDAFAFDQYIGGWNVSSVTNMYTIFGSKSGEGGKFNQFIGNWDVSSVGTMKNAFKNNVAFNQPLQKWDLSSVTDMEAMFNGAISFNQPVDSWTWNASSVTTMESMFDSALSFNQCLSSWAYKVTNFTYKTNMFRDSSCPAGIDTPDGSLGPWCQDSSNQCYGATCVDDPKFRFDGDKLKNCEWVALGKASEKRCAKEGVFQACSQSCNPVCFGGCDDDPGFQLNGVKAKTCDWVAKQKTEERCKKPGVMDRCRATCNSINLDPKCATAVAVDCTDDEDFRLGGLKAQSCEWVAKKTNERCRKTGVTAACRRTCNPVCGCRDSTEEFAFKGTTITCNDLNIIYCDANTEDYSSGSDDFFKQIEAALAPINKKLERLDAIEIALGTAESEDLVLFRDLCPIKCQKCINS
jgi:surface protein